MAASGTSDVTTKIRTKEDAEKQTEQFFQKHDNVFEPILDIIEPGNAALVRHFLARRLLQLVCVAEVAALASTPVGRFDLEDALAPARMEFEFPTELCLLDVHRDQPYRCANFQLLGLLCDELCLRLALLIFRLLVQPCLLRRCQVSGLRRGRIEIVAHCLVWRKSSTCTLLVVDCSGCFA